MYHIITVASIDKYLISAASTTHYLPLYVRDHVSCQNKTKITRSYHILIIAILI